MCKGGWNKTAYNFIVISDGAGKPLNQWDIIIPYIYQSIEIKSEI